MIHLETFSQDLQKVSQKLILEEFEELFWVVSQKKPLGETFETYAGGKSTKYSEDASGII